MTQVRIMPDGGRELEEISNRLRRGVQEIHQNEKALEGWSERIMRSILSPLKNDMERYPIGHGVPNKGGLSSANMWGKL